MSTEKEKTSVDLLVKQTKVLTWDDIILVPATLSERKLYNQVLVGKLISSKTLNKHTFHSTIRAVWSFVPGLIIEDLAPNTYLFTFPSLLDKNRVFFQHPWNFKGYHMILKQWPPGLNIQEIDLTHSAIWIQIYGLPLELMTNENAEKIRRVLGRLMEVDQAYLPPNYVKQLLKTVENRK